MHTQQSGAGTGNWHKWFTVHAAAEAVLQYAGGDGSIRLAIGPGGDGIVVLDQHTSHILETPPGQVLQPLVTPSGTVIWFHDHDGSESGQWLTRPLTGGPAVPLDPTMPRGYFAGAAAGPSSAAVATGTDNGVRVYAIAQASRRPQQIYQGSISTRVRAVSADGELVAISAMEQDMRIAQVLSIQPPSEQPVATFTDLIADVEPVGFLPPKHDHQLLLRHSRPTGEGLVIWDLEEGDEQELPNDLPGDLTEAWVTPDGTILARCYANMQTLLYQVDPVRGQSLLVSPPIGSVGRTVHHSGETTSFTWSALTTPSVVLTANQAPPTCAIGADVQQAHVPTAAGTIPVLIARPTGSSPCGTVFLIHGGPGLAASDSFDPRAAAYLEAGFTVVLANYRGSAGHGAAWRNASYSDGPLAQAADLADVRNWCVDKGIATPANCILHGTSWGGYLALLAAGVHPTLWVGVIAVSPIADMTRAFVEVLPPQQELFKEIFGGPPDRVPMRYQRASPDSYLAELTAPTLIVAYENDARCPLGQIQSYVAHAGSHDKPVELAVLPGGHRGHRLDSRIHQMERCLAFAQGCLSGTAERGLSGR